LTSLAALGADLPVNSMLIIQNISDALELKALPKDKIKAFATENSTADYLKENWTAFLKIFIPGTVILVCGFGYMIHECAKCGPVRRFFDKIEKIIFFNLIIRSVLAIYVNLCITVFVAFFVTKSLNFADMGMTLFLVGVWVFTLVFAIKVKRPTLELDSVKVRISNLYTNLDIGSRIKVAQTSVFFLRRLLFVLILTQTYSFKNVQQTKPSISPIGSLLCIIMTLLHLCYYLHVKPFEDRGFQQLEVFNEVNLLIILNFSPLFSEWIPDPLTKYMIGNYYVLLLGPLFVVNLGRVVYLVLRPIVIKNKKRMVRCCRKNGCIVIKKNSLGT
jgi:hypothetical protein